ncbi:hypothetical protein LCGC14_2670630, partial [marine sediment metagenome]
TAWINVTLSSDSQMILTKYDATTGSELREWLFYIAASETLILQMYDEDTGAVRGQQSLDPLTVGWHFVACTYSGVGGTNAQDGVTLYVDNAEVASADISSLTYVSMVNTNTNVLIGALVSAGPAGVAKHWQDKINNIAIFSKELSADEIASLISTGSINSYEIVTPYLTADLPALKFEQSADVMFITHPSYEPRKLSRLGDASWTIEEADLRTGPFRDQNDDTAKTITASATTGSVTLTAAGHSPFVAGTTAGHLPSGSVNTSKSLTGALFKLVQAVSGTDQSIGETLDSTTVNAVTSTLTVPKSVTWDWTTNGTWGTSGPSTLVLERSYDSGTTYETVATVTSLANNNIVTSGTENVDDALYRTRVLDGTGTGNASIQFSIRDTSHIGIVEITAVASPQSATATVLTTLASTDPTHRFSEGSFSNRRGWPIDVAIASEERLTF